MLTKPPINIVDKSVSFFIKQGDEIPWMPEVIIFFLRAKRASNAAKPRQRGAKRREKK